MPILQDTDDFEDGAVLQTLLDNGNLTVVVETQNGTDSVFITSYGSEAAVVTPPAYACNVSLPTCACKCTVAHQPG